MDINWVNGMENPRVGSVYFPVWAGGLDFRNVNFSSVAFFKPTHQIVVTFNFEKHFYHVM